MDESLTLTCLFEKAVLSRTCGCRYAERNHVGSRPTITCQSSNGHKHCAQVLNFMRKSASFTLGVTYTPSALPHTQATKLQCGGLIGLQNALDKVVQNERVADVYGLIQRALKRYGSLQELPEQDIVRSIASYKK